MATRITAKDMTLSYTGDTLDAVFRRIGFSVDSGEVFCLLGPNGCGKSTLLKCLSGLLMPQKGRVLLNDQRISSLTIKEMAQRIGYVPQSQVSAFPFLVRDIVVMGRAPHLNTLASPSKEDYAMAHEAMETVGILHLDKRPCTSLSGGEWQLTLIARALAQRSPVLLLDEPTSHLDMGNQMRILGVVKTLADRGLTILMASHFPDHAFLISSRVAILAHGTIVEQGPPEAVITERNLKETFHVDVKVMYVGNGVGRNACFPSLTGSSSHSEEVDIEDRPNPIS
jgi:iron complex transport system ATP-binding protein